MPMISLTDDMVEKIVSDELREQLKVTRSQRKALLARLETGEELQEFEKSDFADMTRDETALATVLKLYGGRA